MEEWKTYKLGELAQIKGGKRLPKGVSLTTVSNTHPYIRIRDLGSSRTLELNDTFEYVDDATQKTIARYIVNSGDVLLSIVGTIGLTGIVGRTLDKANLTENCVKIVGTTGVSPKYLYYFLSSPIGQSEITKGIVGAVQPKLPIKNIQQISIPLPPLAAQERIVDILSTIDDKIELNNRINHNLEEQAQALYKSWFVDFEPFKDGEFVDSELGLIPEGWRIGTISELISDTYNGDWGKEESTGVFTKRVFCIRGADIPSIRVGNSGKMPTRFIQEKHFLSKYLKNDDLVIEISGGSPTQSTGRFCRITDDLIERYDHSLICTNFCKAIRPSDGCSLFLSYLWNDLYEKGTMFSYENGTTGIKNLDLSGLIGGEPVIIPDKRSMRLFSIAVSALNKQILFNGHENEKLGEQRDLMLPKLMSGEMLSNNKAY